ncbi:hypothetical protein ABIB83_009139, partial [Bradyrhizobium sp. I1.8.5]|uniref:hypothetical protein n=1 Tax=Bradyrhizobium sp. I1.8.5 TaxID=3156365 RepID=UPI0033988889
GPTPRFPAKSNTTSRQILLISQINPHSSRTTQDDRCIHKRLQAMLDFRTIHSVHREIRAFQPSILPRTEAPETYASVAAVTLMPLIDAISSPALATDRSASDPLGHDESYDIRSHSKNLF